MTTETKIIDGVLWVRADLALPMPVLREEDRSAQVADVLCCARLYASAFRDASAGIWTGPDHMKPSKASYMDLESAVKRLAGVS